MDSGQIIINEKIDFLIVDDDKMLCEMLEDIFLQEEKLKIDSTYNGLDAIKKIKNKKFDLILSDLMMPGANGIEVLKAVRQTTKDTYVIVMTAYGSVNSAVEALKMGAYDYLTKPFSYDELLLTLEKIEDHLKIVEENIYFVTCYQ